MGVTKDKLSRKKPLSTEHFVPADDAQSEALEFAEQRLKIAHFTGNSDEIEKAQAELEAVRSQVREEGISFKITAIGRRRFEELIREHPPTDEGKESGATFNPETLWQELFALSIEGDLTAEDWKTGVIDSDDWGPGELHLLREKVMGTNTGNRVADLGE